jgi:hypothetical protein
MKAKQLDPHLFPRKEVIEEYKRIQYDPEDKEYWGYEPTVHDRVWTTFFYPLATGNKKLEEQEIEYRVDQMTRHKTKDGEWLTYYVSLVGNDWEGNKIDYSYIEGKIENIPIFHRRVDPQTDQIIPGTTQIQDLHDIFTIPFSKQKVEELTEYFSDTISFYIEERRSGRLYICSIQEFRNTDYDELIDIKSGFAEYRKSRQQQQKGGGGVKYT